MILDKVKVQIAYLGIYQKGSRRKERTKAIEKEDPILMHHFKTKQDD